MIHFFKGANIKLMELGLFIGKIVVSLFVLGGVFFLVRLLFDKKNGGKHKKPMSKRQKKVAISKEEAAEIITLLEKINDMNK